VGQNAAGR